MEENATTRGTVQLLTQYQTADCAHTHTHTHTRTHTHTHTHAHTKKVEHLEKVTAENPQTITYKHLHFRSDTTQYFLFLCCNAKSLISNWAYHKTMQGSYKHWREEKHFNNKSFDLGQVVSKAKTTLCVCCCVVQSVLKISHFCRANTHLKELFHKILLRVAGRWCWCPYREKGSDSQSG